MAENTHTMQSWSSPLEFPYHEIVEDNRVVTEGFECKNFSYRDHTVVGVAHAMLANKVPEGESVCFYTASGNTFTFNEALDLYTTEDNTRNVVVYHANRTINLKEIILPDEWHQTDNDIKISEFLQAFVCTKVDNSQTVIALPYNYNLQQWHRLAIVIMRLSMFKDWFDANPVTDEEKLILKSLTENGAQFINMMSIFESKLDISKFRINKYLNGWITDVKQAQIERLNSDYSYYSSNIKDYQERLQEQIRKLREISQKVSVLQMNMKDDTHFEEEIKDYLLHTPTIMLRNKCDSYLYYTSYGYFVMLDEDKELLETFINNPDSILYEYNYGYSHEVLEKFYTDVYIKERWKVKCCGSFYINNLAEVRTDSSYDSKVHQYMYYPNPHLEHYDCLGGHTALLTEAAQSLDYVGALIITQQATNNLNWSDGVVMERFIRDTFDRYTDITCYEDANGELHTIGSVLSIIKDELAELGKPTMADYATYNDEWDDEDWDNDD